MNDEVTIVLYCIVLHYWSILILKVVEGVRLIPWLTLSHVVDLENNMVNHIW